MTVDFSTRTLQIYEADTKSLERGLKQKDRAEATSARVVATAAKKSSTAVEVSSKKQVKATKSVSNHFDILTMAIGGMSSEVGVAAETGKRLSEGFGALGVATMGVGLALGALAPHISNAISGLGDLLGLGSDSKDWKKFEENLANVRKEAARLNKELRESNRQFMTTFEAAQDRRLEAVEEVAVAEKKAADARFAAAKATADLIALESELGDGRSKESFIMRGLHAEELREAELLAESREKEAEAATAAAGIAANAAKVAQQNMRLADPLIRKEKEKTEATKRRTRAIEDQNKALVKNMALLARRGFGAIGEARVVAEAGLSAGISAVDRASVAGGVAVPGAIPGIGPQAAPPIDEETMRKGIGLAVEGSTAFNHFRDAALNAFAAVTSGSMSAGQALKQFFADSLTGMGLEAAGKSISMLVSAAVAAANPATAALAPGYLSAAAFAASKAAIMLGIASQLGTSTSVPTTGGFSTGAVGTGATATTTTTTVINLGDSYIGLSNRRRKAELQRLLRSGRDGGGGSYEG